MPGSLRIQHSVGKECEETTRRLSSHLEGELPWWARRRVARHLSRCPDCARVFSSLARAVDGLRSVGRADAEGSSSVVEAVMERVRKERMGA